MTILALIDNGSRRPEATLLLRHLSRALGKRLGSTVHPVSLAHVSTVPAARLDGRPAETLEPFLRRSAAAEPGTAIVLVPLFFGPSRALTSLVPKTVQAVAETTGPLRVELADVLCPLPRGEPRLVSILEGHLHWGLARQGSEPKAQSRHAVLVDHGSPIPEVTAVRRWLAEGLRQRLSVQCVLSEAVMERREGVAYDFNGALLETLLEDLGSGHPEVDAVLVMQFLLPGRHAGEGGDVASICAAAMARYPGLRVTTTPLVGAHPLLIDILVDRARGALQRL